MDLERTLAELRRELERVEQAILDLHRLANIRPYVPRGSPGSVTEITTKRPGRPPRSKNPPKTRPRRTTGPLSDET